MNDDRGTLKGVTGNTTRAPELRYSPNGTAVSKFSIAVNPYVPRGASEAPTEFYDIVAFGSLAENIVECVQKGDRVTAWGMMKLKTWTAQDGSERTALEIVAEGFGHDLRFATTTLTKNDRRQMDVIGKTAALSPYADDEEPF
jgi:single-strand DNA-binding protein